MTNCKAIALRTTKLMLERNMTAYAVCNKSYIPFSTMFNILNEKHTDCNLTIIYKLAFAFDMDILEFLDDEVFKKVDILKELVR